VFEDTILKYELTREWKKFNIITRCSMELAFNLKREELKALIKEAVREVIKESRWEFFEKRPFLCF
jgi:hypothetical protein